LRSYQIISMKELRKTSVRRTGLAVEIRTTDVHNIKP
jgi:hypothetical protein